MSVSSESSVEVEDRFSDRVQIFTRSIELRIPLDRFESSDRIRFFAVHERSPPEVFSSPDRTSSSLETDSRVRRLYLEQIAPEYLRPRRPSRESLP